MHQDEDRQLGNSAKTDHQEVNATLAADLKIYARRRWPLTTDEWRWHRLAVLIGVRPRRMKSLYQGEHSAVLRKREADAIEQLIRAKDEANRNDFEDLQARIARIEAALFAQDEDFHHEQMAALREATGRGR